MGRVQYRGRDIMAPDVEAGEILMALIQKDSAGVSITLTHDEYEILKWTLLDVDAWSSLKGVLLVYQLTGVRMPTIAEHEVAMRLVE